jgi:hypothetical protein
METWLIPYALMNMFGSVLVLVFFIFFILYEKGKVETKTFRMIFIVFAILVLAYGVYQLSVADLLRKVYPGKYYTAGGWIAISIGIIILFRILFGLRKNINRKGK